MSPSIEPLPSRLYLAAAPDPSFGKDGVAAVVGTGEVAFVLGANHSVYVVRAVAKSLSYVTRLNEDGTPDAGWGTDGRAAVPFNSTEQMAYDKRRDQLVVAGYRRRAIEQTTPLQVVKLNADGTRATEFGTDGLFQYAPTPPSGRNDGAAADAETMTVLPHGGLLIGMKVTGYDNSSDGNPSDQTIDSTLLRLNGSGKKQLDFGHRGTVTLASGSAYIHHVPGPSGPAIDQFDDVPGFGSVRALDDGRFEAVLVRSDPHQPADATAYTASAEVLTRTTDARGGVDPSADAAWKVYDAATAGADPSDKFYAGAFATDDGVSVVSLGSTTGTRVFDLTPGRKPRPRQVVLPSDAPKVDRYFTVRSYAVSKDGYTVLGRTVVDGGSAGFALRLTPKLEADPDWCDRGVVTVDPTLPLLSPTLDDQGRVLAFGDGRVERYLV